LVTCRATALAGIAAVRLVNSVPFAIDFNCAVTVKAALAEPQLQTLSMNVGGSLQMQVVDIDHGRRHLAKINLLLATECGGELRTLLNDELSEEKLPGACSALGCTACCTSKSVASRRSLVESEAASSQQMHVFHSNQESTERERSAHKDAVGHDDAALLLDNQPHCRIRGVNVHGTNCEFPTSVHSDCARQVSCHHARVDWVAVAPELKLCTVHHVNLVENEFSVFVELVGERVAC
jgi:hypothetical protein